MGLYTTTKAKYLHNKLRINFPCPFLFKTVYTTRKLKNEAILIYNNIVCIAM